MKLRQQKSLIFGHGIRDSPCRFPIRAGLETGQSWLFCGRARTRNDDERPQLDLGRDASRRPFIMHGKTLSHGYTFSQFSKEIESQTTRTQTAQGFEGGLCLPSRLIDLDTVIGLTWFLPNQHITSLRTQSPRGPMMVFFEDRLDRLAIVSSIAMGERDVWGVGLGIEHLATTVGKSNSAVSCSSMRPSSPTLREPSTFSLRVNDVFWHPPGWNSYLLYAGALPTLRPWG